MILMFKPYWTNRRTLVSSSPRSVAIHYLDEPKLEFAHGRRSEDPKAGLFAYGPPDLDVEGSSVRLGVIGTRSGISIARAWFKKMSSHVPAARSDTAQYLPFPGFQSAFGKKWSKEPATEVVVDHANLLETIRNKDTHQRVYATVSIYEEKIRRHISEEEVIVDVWLVVIPDDVYKYCRPKSSVSAEEAIPSSFNITKRMSRHFLGRQQALFEEDANQAQIYRYHPDFHNQLKARLLRDKAIVQIARESTLIPQSVDQPRTRQDDSMVAWNLSTALYYKSGGRPWMLSGIRDGVCYVGLVFKVDDTETSKANVCCGAQLFLSNGDGVVFKVAKGDFRSSNRDDFHLSKSKAKLLTELVVQSYKDRMNDTPPKEIFIHGRTWFNQSEIDGFKEGCPPNTSVSCVRIQSSNQLKLFTQREMPALRGNAFIENDQSGYLWTKGFIPQIRTYPGREVPNPLSVKLVHGNAPIKVVLEDLMALTKLNFNSCVYGDGLPVTIRFANAVGEILTSAPIPDGRPLPFRHYI